MEILYIIAVLLGFVFMFVSTWGGVPAWSTRAAWGCWLVAALLWAVPQLGLH